MAVQGTQGSVERSGVQTTGLSQQTMYILMGVIPGMLILIVAASMYVFRKRTVTPKSNAQTPLKVFTSVGEPTVPKTDHHVVIKMDLGAKKAKTESPNKGGILKKSFR
jgi:flagellar basal body-associated protein FliL